VFGKFIYFSVHHTFSKIWQKISFKFSHRNNYVIVKILILVAKGKNQNCFMFSKFFLK